MLERTQASEMLDGYIADGTLLADSFAEVWGVNRYLGGMAVLQRYLAHWLRRRRQLTLLDVAGGAGDVAAALQAWAGHRHNAQLTPTLVDNHPQVLSLARGRLGDQNVVDGDARRLPFRRGAFDVAICNLALHHFSEAEAALVLRELDRVARLGWVVSDLERHPLAYAAARMLAATLWRNPITRHDGPLSVRRAYQVDELQALVARAGVEAQVVRHFPFRLAIVCRRR